MEAKRKLVLSLIESKKTKKAKSEVSTDERDEEKDGNSNDDEIDGLNM